MLTPHLNAGFGADQENAHSELPRAGLTEAGFLIRSAVEAFGEDRVVAIIPFAPESSEKEHTASIDLIEREDANLIRIRQIFFRLCLFTFSFLFVSFRFFSFLFFSFSNFFT